MEHSYAAFIKTCRVGVSSSRLRPHHVRKAFRGFLESTYGLVPTRIYRKKFHEYLCRVRGVEYDPESQLYYGLALRQNVSEPSNRKSPNGKRIPSEMDESSSESIENKLQLVHPLLFIDRFGMPPIYDKITIERDELYGYVQWNQQQRDRIASYTVETDLDKEAQTGLLKMLEEEKSSVDDMYLRPRASALQFSQVYFTRPVEQENMEDL